jgi:hypothetical protein
MLKSVSTSPLTPVPLATRPCRPYSRITAERAMILFQKRIQKRRMPEEKIAGYMEIVEFDKAPAVWMEQFEAVLHKILRWEFYLDKVPENLSLPKYRAILVRIIFRMLCNVPNAKRSFSRQIDPPDPWLKEILDFLRQAEIKRKEALIRRYPITQENIRSILIRLKEDLEI